MFNLEINIYYVQHTLCYDFFPVSLNPPHLKIRTIVEIHVVRISLDLFHARICSTAFSSIFLHFLALFSLALSFFLIFSSNYRLYFALVCNTVEPINPRYITDSFQIKTRTPSLALYIITLSLNDYIYLFFIYVQKKRLYCEHGIYIYRPRCFTDRMLARIPTSFCGLIKPKST